MTLAITLPYERPSPVHIPRRDLVLGAADSLYLQVSVVQSDWPGAPPIVLTGGIGGPALRLYVWAASAWHHGWDYGAPTHCRGTMLWSGLATIASLPDATFLFSFPTGTMAAWPLRCGFALQLEWDSARQVELLAQGYLHTQRTGQTLVPLHALSTDAGELMEPTGSTLVLGA